MRPLRKMEYGTPNSMTVTCFSVASLSCCTHSAVSFHGEKSIKKSRAKCVVQETLTEDVFRFQDYRFLLGACQIVQVALKAGILQTQTHGVSGWAAKARKIETKQNAKLGIGRDRASRSRHMNWFNLWFNSE
ncbi:hypothetical protein C8R44DRAFT_742377 [Mycena epipterygia]|nr:hypothetical protein C8R44DRAFT_742377 [Mycena epipterygia]